MNVIWFILDTLRADHLGCYGNFRQTSSNIDRLAGEGMLFTDSYASAIATGPDFTSLFTGPAAMNHGFYLTPWDVPNAPLLDDQIATLPETSTRFDGQSLLELARGERQAPQEIVVEAGEHRAYLAPPWKLIWYKDERPSELFHLSNDPLELNDRANDEPQTVGDLEEKLIRWVERNLAGAPPSPDNLPPAKQGGLRGGQGPRTDPLYAAGGAWTCYINIGRRGE